MGLCLALPLHFGKGHPRMRVKSLLQKYLTLFLCAFAIQAGNAFSAPAPSVTGTLSRPVVGLDDLVSLRFVFYGEPFVLPPKEVNVDGLLVSFAGTNTAYNYSPSSNTESVTLT